jgi:glycosyltransferase involved in cell wall biosynthesis
MAGVGSDELLGRDMLCFGHDWSGDPLSKTHLMRLLARHNRILWINSIGYRAPTASARDFSRAWSKLKAFAEPVKEVEKNIFVLNPIAIPAYGSALMRAANKEILRFVIKRAMKRLGMKNPIDWVFNPTGSVVAGSLGESRLIYYCVDDFTAFSDAGTSAMVQMEERLLRDADLTIVSSQRLYESKSKLARKIVLVRHGVDFQHFQKALDPQTQIPDDLARLPRPIIGYFGLMAADWIDIALLEEIARHFSGGSLVLLGKITTDLSRLQALPNVHLLGRKPFQTLPAYSKGFDVAINPFPISEVTLNANPLKVREYLAAGLPVVSTKIPEVEVLDAAAIGETHQQFITKIEEALRAPGPSRARSDSMSGHSWEGRVEELRRHMAALPARL